MTTSSPPPCFPDAQTLLTVRTGLAANGYDGESICAHLACSAWADLAALGHGALRHRARSLPPALAMLVELFPLALGVPSAAAVQVLEGPFLAALERAGMLERSDGIVRAAVALTPLGGLLCASDLAERHVQRSADFVLAPGGVTRHLADLALPRKGGSVLDLGCGSGILGALCASRAERVVATDVNPRAVAFSRFNAELNGLRNMTCREGNLFEPVQEERFDLVLCNPPYVISPDSTFIYRDGAADLCRAVVRGARAHLTDGGTLQMLAEWPERSDADWKEEVGSWLQDSGCDAWVLRMYTHPAESHALRWLSQEYGRGEVPEEVFDAWVAYLDGLGIDSVGGGLLVLRPSRRPTPVRVFRDAPPIVPPSGRSLERWLDGQELLAGLDDQTALLDVTLIPAADLERRYNRSATGEGWIGRGPQLRVTRGLAFGARVDPLAAELVGWLGPERTPRQALALLAAEFGVPAEPFLEGLPGALARLVSLGILHPSRERDG
jgi:methylase of polypeptide subunit release factors